MAIIVPILLSYTGAAAAIGTAIGISATAVSAIASLAFQVTGINNKINKAASKVFGEDLVMIANVAGAVYGAVNGGFGGGTDAAAAATDASSALAVNGMDAASDAFSAAGGLASDGLTALSSTSDASSLLATNGMDVADNTFNLANRAAGGGLASDGVGISSTTPGPSQGVNLLDSSKEVGVDTKSLADATKTAEDTGAAKSIAPTPATGQTAAAPVSAPAAQTTAAAPTAAGAKAAAATTKPGSFFDKLLSNDKAVGEIIKGVGGGIVGAANNKAEEKKLAWQKQRYTSTPTTRIVQ